MSKKISNMDLNTYAKESLLLAKKIFPINRSINSTGTIETLKLIKETIPVLKIKRIAANKKIGDWKIPKRWHLNKGEIRRMNGEKVLDFNDHNLHVVSHSIKVSKKISLKELQKKIYTLEKYPNAIPYRTSFYKNDWGFCMEHNRFLAMQDKEYKVLIDSKFTNDPMNYGEVYIPGRLKNKEILFSTYICHPSMANNELSGPVVSTSLIKYLMKRRNKFSYRFLFLPETIGAISYINSNIEKMKKNIFAGLVLTCVGDERKFSIVKNKDGINCLENIVIQESKKVSKKYDAKLKIYDFNMRQSDERQYCSPGVDLPISCFCRSKYASYNEYHTSLDNFDVVTQTGLKGSLEVIINSLNTIESQNFPKAVFLGEPNLGKRGLYPLMGAKRIGQDVRDIKNFLAYSNGLNSLDDIANLAKIKIKDVRRIYKILIKKGVII